MATSGYFDAARKSMEMQICNNIQKQLQTPQSETIKSVSKHTIKGCDYFNRMLNSGKYVDYSMVVNLMISRDGYENFMAFVKKKPTLTLDYVLTLFALFFVVIVLVLMILGMFFLSNF